MNLKKYITECGESGSITVFLSLILLLILSLLLTITEGARVSSAKVYAERSLSTAMDSVFAEYYGPLWEEYHIFGLYTGEGSDIKQKEEIEAGLSDYMSYTFDPDKDFDTKEKSFWDLYDINLDTASLEDTTRLMDYQGELLINEAAAYMKYKETGNGIELLLDKMSLLETPKKVSYLSEEKEKAEEDLIEIDRGILELMELLDGIKTGKKGIKVSKGGALKTVNYFVKKICLGEVTKEEVGINQENIFQALKGCYTNPMTEFNLINENFSNLQKIIKEVDEIKNQKDSIVTDLSKAQFELGRLNAITKKSKSESQKIRELTNSINAIGKQTSECDERIQKQEEAKSRCCSEIEDSCNNLLQLITETKPIIYKAESAIDGIILKAETVAPIIEKYENTLNSYCEVIDKDTFSGLKEGLKEMKKYISADDSGYDFHGMKKILENDFAILTMVEKHLNQSKNELLINNYQDFGRSLNNAKNEIAKYQIKGLTLDYSTLVIDKSDQENPINAINDLMQSGILSMVIDPDKISDRKLTLNMLPSQEALLSDGSTDFLSKLIEFFKSAAGDGSPDTGGLFDSFGNGTNILSMAGDGVNKIAEQILYQEYLKEHFENYTSNMDYSKENSIKNDVQTSSNKATPGMVTPKTYTTNEKSSLTSLSKPSVLDYEQEYLLEGHLTDKENLSGVINRIIFLRTIFDFVSILGDSVKRNEARAAAAAMVGFSGLPFLVSLTQVLILLTWSFAEALLDVNSLMSGNEVPVLKKKIVLELPDLFMLNRQLLESKAKLLNVSKKSKELSLSYQDYLRIFLLLKDKKDLAYHSMDLMQENIKIRYEDSTFDITDCLFGCKASITYTIPPKFTGVFFVQKYLNADSRGFRFTAEAAYSY